jgi:N-acetylneuraminic acid mutarotase
MLWAGVVKIETLEERVLLSSTALDWQTAAVSPLVRAEGSKAVVNNKMYIVGGFSGSNLAVTKELDVYDPAINTWIRLADMPVPETHGGTAVDGTDIWVAGFFLNNGISASKLVYKYDTVANVWTQEPSLPAGRGAAGVAIINHVLHVWGGLTGMTTSAADHWELDVNNLSAGWKTDASLPQALDHMGSLSLDGKLWSIGGFKDKQETDGNLTIVYRYDPTTDSWAHDVAELPVGLGHIGPDTTVAGDKIIIAGGQIDASFVDEITQVLEYDPDTNAWSKLTPLPSGRKSAFCAFADGKLIVSCGNQETSPYASAVTWTADFDPDPTVAPPVVPPPVIPPPVMTPPPVEPPPVVAPPVDSPPVTPTPIPTDPNGPDFFGAFQGRIPASMIAGDIGHATVIVSNDGPGSAIGKFEITLAVSADGLVSDAATVATLTVNKLRLLAGKKRALILRFQLPADLISGDYTFLASIDNGNNFVESNELNNIATGPKTAVAAQVQNLAVMDWTMKSSLRVGTEASAGFWLENTGNVKESGDVTLTLSDVTGGMSVKTIVRHLAIGAGGHRAMVLSFRVPTGWNGQRELAVNLENISAGDQNPADDSIARSVLVD